MRDYLSASAINLYLTCPTSFFFKYVFDLPSEDTNDTYARYGTLVHEINENIANKQYEELDQALYEYMDRFDSCGVPNEGYYDEGLRGIERQWQWVNESGIEVVGAEVKFSVKPLVNVPKYFGFVDLVFRDENGHLAVKDYKTSKPYDDKKILTQIQPYFYAEAVLDLFGELPRYFEFDFTRFGKSKTVIIDEEFIQFNRLRIQGIWNKVESGIMQSKWNPFFCENFCSNKSSCPLYQIKRGGVSK